MKQAVGLNMNEALELYPGLYAETWYEDEEKSVALVTLNGLNNRIVNRRSDMTYQIVAGCGIFNVGDSCIRFVQSGETITIPAGTRYQDEGRMMMIATAVPPFNPSDVVTLEKF